MIPPADEPSAANLPVVSEPAPPATRPVAASRRFARGRWWAEWILIIGAALLAALVIKTFLLQAFYIPSESMTPTLAVRDRVLVNKVSYHVHHVHRGDIVVFRRPRADPGEPQIKDLIKRVIGLPEETIEAHDNQIFVDGRGVREPYLPPGTITANFAPVRIPAHAYFVMGDNRTNSRDSRFIGPIGEKLLIGRAFVRIWPVTKLGLL